MAHFLDPRSDLVLARKLRWAWLKFLREAGDAGSQGHLSVAEFCAQVGINEPLRQALSIAEECGFSPAQLERYDAFWDAVRIERTLLTGKFAEGKAEGKAETLLETAAGMKAAGIAAETIARISGLPMERIAEL
jgi:hypothetical protein